MIDGFQEEKHVDISVDKDARDVDNGIFEFLYGLNQGNLRPGTSDSHSEEVQVNGGYILVESEGNVIRMGFEDVVMQLGSVIGVIKVDVGFLGVEDVVVRGRSSSGGRHEDDESVEKLEVVGKVVFF